MYVSVTFIKDSGRVDKDRKTLIRVNQSGSSEKKKKKEKVTLGEKEWREEILTGRTRDNLVSYLWGGAENTSWVKDIFKIPKLGNTNYGLVISSSRKLGKDIKLGCQKHNELCLRWEK